jgi:L(+)-tartrate dehydratase beta subunit
MKEVKLQLPASTADLRALEIGTVVYLSGRIFTAREGVYKKAVEEAAGLPAPAAELGSANFHCSPAASLHADGSATVGAVTATASFRFAKWLDGWFKLSGCNIIIGKGGMTSDIYKRCFVPNNAIYLTTVGYGTGALLGRGIKRVLATHWTQELGLAQAIWVLEVDNFGPFIADSDLAGNSLFERENAKIARHRETLCRQQTAHHASLRRDRRQDRRSDLTSYADRPGPTFAAIHHLCG